MKNRINTLFEEKQKNILSVYYPAGFPRLEDTLPVLTELQAAGANMVEIGIPFSDPMADGTVIQNASGVALRNGISLKKIFTQLEALRSTIHIPVILMGYLNPIMQYGFERFCQSCVQTGVDGMIIPDLPFADYVSHYKSIAERHHLNVIMLITPETSEDRVRLIDQNTAGFIYMVSSASTTGVQKDFNQAKQDYFERINRMGLKNPRLVGFGVSNKQTLDAANANASGAIVGSKFVQLLENSESTKEAVQKLLAGLRE